MNIKELINDRSYWEDKLIAYMHDPFDKALRIKDHIDRAAKYMKIFGIQMPNEEFWGKADAIAAGFERGILPGYKKDESVSGAIDFLKEEALLTHPIGSYDNSNLKNAQIKFEIEEYNIDEIFFNIELFLQKESEKLNHISMFDSLMNIKRNLFYIHFFLRHRLAQEDKLKLGPLWYKIPADTRIPDHSIWEHNALTSALASILKISNDDHNNLGLMVFSITPVQSFINKARKLRDFWSGSLILSWLAFEGLVWIIENIGFDHVLYPSLFDQPLMFEYLKNKWVLSIEELNIKNININKSVASFPNKFMFLVPFDAAEEIGKEIESRILEKWNEIIRLSYNNLVKILNITNEDSEIIKILFDRQTYNYWTINWAATKLVYLNDEVNVLELIDKAEWKKYSDLYEKFSNMNKQEYTSSSIGTFYPISNQLVQASLQASKTKKIITRQEENGEKCHLCGEFEVINPISGRGELSAKEYKNKVNEFWDKVRKKYGENEIKENEKLCSICLTKRFIYKLFNNTEHYLKSTFKEAENFQTTTYISLHNYFKRLSKKLNQKINEDVKREIADELFNSANDEINIEKYFNKDKDNSSIPKIKEYDKYYAILIMDGDKMGQLISGKTIEAKWENVIHPELVQKIKNNKLEYKFNDNWNKIFSNNIKRSITPAIHSAISSALTDFSVNIVPHIVEDKYDGRLIYAGGDDVLAILPPENAFSAAKEIKEVYNSYFKLVKNEGDNQNITKPGNILENGKLATFIGKGKDLSISAGILICHHKESLSQMIERAHNLLEYKAKNEGGRNSCAIELKKRSGESRYLVRKWNDKAWESFKNLIELLSKQEEETLARSFAYKLDNYMEGLNAIIELDSNREKKSLVEKFILSLVKKSGYTHKNYEIIKKISNKITDVVFIEENNKIETEGLIIASFLSNYSTEDNKND